MNETNLMWVQYHIDIPLEACIITLFWLTGECYKRQCFYNYGKSCSLQHSLLPIAGGRTELVTCDQSKYCKKLRYVYNKMNANGPHVRGEIGHTRYFVIHFSAFSIACTVKVSRGHVARINRLGDCSHWWHVCLCVPYPLCFSLICVYLKWNFSPNFVFHFW